MLQVTPSVRGQTPPGGNYRPEVGSGVSLGSGLGHAGLPSMLLAFHVCGEHTEFHCFLLAEELGFCCCCSINSLTKAR